MGLIWFAAIWGAAEASFFFLVPDILISALALSSLKRALCACLAALAGALIAGIGLYYWGVIDITSAWTFVEAVPAISPEMLERVEQELTDEGIWAILLGPLSGTPYKTYAIQAASAGITITAFLLISIPARLSRFVLVALISYGIKQWCLYRLSRRWQLGCWALFWLGFYLWYFSVMTN